MTAIVYKLFNIQGKTYLRKLYTTSATFQPEKLSLKWQKNLTVGLNGEVLASERSCLVI